MDRWVGRRKGREIGCVCGRMDRWAVGMGRDGDKVFGGEHIELYTEVKI